MMSESEISIHCSLAILIGAWLCVLFALANPKSIKKLGEMTLLSTQLIESILLLLTLLTIPNFFHHFHFAYVDANLLSFSQGFLLYLVTLLMVLLAGSDSKVTWKSQSDSQLSASFRTGRTIVYILTTFGLMILSAATLCQMLFGHPYSFHSAFEYQTHYLIFLVGLSLPLGINSAHYRICKKNSASTGPDQQ